MNLKISHLKLSSQRNKRKRIKWRKPRGLRGHYKLDQYIHHRSPRRRREKGGRQLILRNNDQKFPNLREEMDIQIQEAQKIPARMNPKKPTLRWWSNCQKAKEGNNLEGNNTEINLLCTMEFIKIISVHKIISRFLSRNVAGQKGMERYN